MLNKNTLGVKKYEAKKQHCKWVTTYATKSFDINQGQEIIYQNPLSCLNDNSLQCILTTMIGFVTWTLFCTYHHYYKGGQVIKPLQL